MANIQEEDVMLLFLPYLTLSTASQVTAVGGQNKGPEHETARGGKEKLGHLHLMQLVPFEIWIVLACLSRTAAGRTLPSC